MAERSFAKEVEKLRAGEGETFHGEGILAVTKALLQSGVAYVDGYPGAPVSHLMDVLSDAQKQGILDEWGVHFESSASEATAAATLAASVNYPVRGAVAWKSPVGTNVASDALANLSSGGVLGGALIIIGEDYGEGSSVVQERSHAFAMKSQVWLLDPRPDLTSIVDMVEHGFRLSEASNTPVMLQLRIRTCHVHGRFIAKDNRRPDPTLAEVMENPVRDINRIVLPPVSFVHEEEKLAQRWPAATRYIKENRLNEIFESVDGHGEIGLVMQGGMYNSVNRALELLDLSDSFGNSRLPAYLMNVTYPLVDEELVEFCNGKKAVLLIEEGQPNYIEQALNTILRRADLQTVVVGKDILPASGEYTGQILKDGLTKFVKRYCPEILDGYKDKQQDERQTRQALKEITVSMGDNVPARPPGLCTGCPERPLFTAIKLLQREMGEFHISGDIGCHLFSILPPFNIGNTTMGYGLGAAGASAFSVDSRKRSISLMGDGGFWHNGLTSGIGNAVFNKSDNIIIIVDNGYAAATGGQDNLSSKSVLRERSTNNRITDAVKGVGATWVRQVRTYDIGTLLNTLREAVTTRARGPKIIVAESECMLNKQRRIKPLFNKARQDGNRIIRERFGVDADTCTGDHSCIRLSGCPSLSIAENPDPLRQEPVAAVQDSCVGCGVCGEISHAAVLCPSFYRTDLVYNAGKLERIVQGFRNGIIGFLQGRVDKKLDRYAF